MDESDLHTEPPPALEETAHAVVPPQRMPYGMVVPYVPMPSDPVGKIRPTGFCILLTIATLGIYAFVWYFKVHAEMKRHSRDGLGGGLAELLALVIGIVMPYVTSSQVGHLYESRGMRRPVSGATGLWVFPGVVLIVGPLVWFVKTNGALNKYWRAMGAS